MGKLDRIVNVAISLNTTAIKEQSFSDMLILGPHNLGIGRSLAITDSDELLDLGMALTDPIYLAAVSAFSQIPSVRRVFIGRQQVNSRALTVTSAVVGNVYTATFDWYDGGGVPQHIVASFTAPGSPTPTTVATGLAAAINATAVNVTAVAAGAVVTLTTDTPGTPFGLSFTGAMTVSAATTSELPAAALAATQVENDDWYGVVITSRTNADILSAAAWVEANEKLLGVSSSDPLLYSGGSTTDILSLLQQNQFFRTFVYYHARAATEWVEAAIMSKAFTFYPGAETWANKRLGGITYDNLAEGQAQAIFNKQGNTFEPFRNFAITQNGRVAAGEWIDVIRFRDWLAEQCKISIVSALINADGKVPYTDPGIAIIVAALRKVLDLGVTRGGIAPQEVDADDDQRLIPSYVINRPLSSAVSFNNKANRVLQDLNFTARLAGAIHTVELKGSLTYDNL